MLPLLYTVWVLVALYKAREEHVPDKYDNLEFSQTFPLKATVVS